MFSGQHLWIWAIVALLVFGGSGKISSIMGDVAKGIKSFKKGMADDDDEVAAKSSKQLEAEAQKPGEQTKVG